MKNKIESGKNGRHSAIGRRRFMGTLLTAVIGAQVAFSAQKQEEKIKPNLLFVFSDQHRRASLGFMKEDPVVTPNLDKLAKGGVAFTKASSNTPLCTPYRGILMTGRYALSSGITYNGAHMTQEYKTLAQVMEDGGYYTGFVGKWHLAPKQYAAPKYRGGFDFWHANNYNGDHFRTFYFRDGPKPYIDQEGWNIPHEVDVSIEFIDKAQKQKEPFALVWAPHVPHSNDEKGYKKYEQVQQHERLRGEFYKRDDYYTAPEAYMKPYYDMKIERRPNVPKNGNGGEDGLAIEACPGYFGMVNALDEEMGRLMQELEKPDTRYPGKKLKETTIVVFTSDHGEMLGSHSMTQKSVPYEEAIGVPMIFSWDGHISKNVQREDLISAVDLMPSVLGLMGLPIPETTQGTDFSPLLLGEKFSTPKSAFLAIYTFKGLVDKAHKTNLGEGHWRGVKTAQYTYAIIQKGFFSGAKRFDGLTDTWGKLDRTSKEKIEVLFDNEADPYQMNPFTRGKSAETDKVMDELKKEVMKYLVQTNDPWMDEI